jgi:glutathione S-transferase
MVMDHKLVLWGVGTSRTIRAHWALHELDLPYESRPILPRSGETKTPEYTALNARQKIPLLVDGDFRIGESAAIVAYLSQTYSTPDHVLIPQEKSLQAKWLEWCFFVVAELDSTSLYVMRRHGTNNGLAHIYGEAPAVVSKAAEYFREQLQYVDVALADGRTYLMGDQFTTADIILTTCLTWAIDYGVGICDSALPYLERTRARPAYQRASAANMPKVAVTASS